MPHVTRREFVKAAAVAAPLMLSRATTAQPNETVRHAAIGMGGQGRRLAQLFDANDDCEVVAVCDVDPARRAEGKRDLGRDAVTEVDDFRRIIEDDSIDTVSIATPDHWHTPIALHAIPAGKHVYVEKPCSHNVREGVLLVEAAREHGACVQHGTQSRSGQGIMEAVQFLREGGIGKVRMAKAINHQLRGPIGRAEETDPPQGVDYDLWLGPAPKVPFTRNRWHYQWHWMWDYGTGDIGNDGVHQIDVARWGLDVGLPSAVSASGGQLFYDDDHETPDTQVVTFEYDDCYLLYEMRLWTNYGLEGHDNGVVFYGDNGTVEVGRNGCEVTLIGEEKRALGGGSDIESNVRNFLDCVKAGDPTGLNAPAHEAACSAALCHLGNIATRVGRTLQFDAEAMRCVGDQQATKMLKRSYRKGYELPSV